MKKRIVIIFVFVFGLCSGFISAGQNNSGEPIKILFIGSSYFNFHNLPWIFENLAVRSGKEVYIDKRMESGLYLADHVSLQGTTIKIRERDWDYIVLQGVGPLIAYPETYTAHAAYPALVNLRNKIKNNCESTRMVFCMPWAFEDGMTWVAGWTDEYDDMQLKIYNNTIKYSDEIGFEIAPVGWAWNTVLEERNYPLHYLHMSDWNHPSLKGSYLMACVLFSAIFQESSVNNSYYGGLPEEEAMDFQEVASSTVLNNLELWNIINPTGIGEELKQNGFSIHQNFPNPFNSSTCINYEISENSFVEIEVFNLSGTMCEKLVSEQKTPGNYSVRFDGNGLNSGTYYYIIKIGNQYQTRKLLLIK